ncbi:MAG: 2-oxo acid dehydrogenase subunit E2, partial [Acidimicrobiia bacterium]
PTEFKLPELGENIESGDVIRVMVAAGDRIERDQPVLELETDKATIEVPSAVAGTIRELKVKPGDKVKVGQSILTVDNSPAEAGEARGKPPESARATQSADEEKQPVDRNRPSGASKADRPTEAAFAERQEAPTDTPEPASRPRRGEVVDISRGSRAVAEPEPVTAEVKPAAPAAPSVRRLARELGVDIDGVPGSGPAGRISIEDVKTYAKWLITTAGSAPGRTTVLEKAEPLPDFSRWGEIERVGMSSIRRKTAENVSHAWNTIPHVTQHDLADLTELDRLREQFGKAVEQSGGKLTVTAVMLKIVGTALKVFPQFNASVDAATEEILYKKYIHIGVAVDTDRGLLVPVIRDVSEKNIVQISVELAELAEKARSRKLTLEEMQGGSFTIT